MGYKQRSWRDTTGAPREPDPLEETHNDLRILLEEESSGTYAQPNKKDLTLLAFQEKVLERFAKIEARLGRLWDRVLLLLFICSVLFMSSMAILFKAK